jgi:AcrR family transcriptional regulator
MVRSAATLMRERGIHGVGLREIVVHSGGPRGSLGRFFPGGKTQLMTEAIDVVIAELGYEVEEALAQAKTFPDAIGVLV